MFQEMQDRMDKLKKEHRVFRPEVRCSHLDAHAVPFSALFKAFKRADRIAAPPHLTLVSRVFGSGHKRK